MNYKVILTKIKSTHNNIRTETIEGECMDLPEVGKKFLMTGKGLEFGIRLVMTSFVTETDRPNQTIKTWREDPDSTIRVTNEPTINVINFKTENSTYKLSYQKIE